MAPLSQRCPPPDPDPASDHGSRLLGAPAHRDAKLGSLPPLSLRLDPSAPRLEIVKHRCGSGLRPERDVASEVPLDQQRELGAVEQRCSSGMEPELAMRLGEHGSSELSRLASCECLCVCMCVCVRGGGRGRAGGENLPSLSLQGGTCRGPVPSGPSVRAPPVCASSSRKCHLLLHLDEAGPSSENCSLLFCLVPGGGISFLQCFRSMKKLLVLPKPQLLHPTRVAETFDHLLRLHPLLPPCVVLPLTILLRLRAASWPCLLPPPPCQRQHFLPEGSAQTSSPLLAKDSETKGRHKIHPYVALRSVSFFIVDA